jgi:serine/threonine-protein kinase SRPK3
MYSTDIQAKNIIIGTNDSSVFEEWDREEQTEPSARKVDEDKVVYQSRPFYRKGNIRRFALPVLSDFGEARIGDLHHGIIQPDIYRAPEVILGMKWTSKVDIWNVGVLVSVS